jgi:hypothetical protein
LGLFFDTGTTGSRQANPVFGPIGQINPQLCLAPPDRFLVQSRHLADQACATMTAPIGFNRRIPAPLLFIKSAHDHIDLMMDYFLTMIFFSLADLTLTLMKWFSTQLF